jgi:hypothetical protein
MEILIYEINGNKTILRSPPPPDIPKAKEDFSQE